LRLCVYQYNRRHSVSLVVPEAVSCKQLISIHTFENRHICRTVVEAVAAFTSTRIALLLCARS
jgi:hypothetical protein